MATSSSWTISAPKRAAINKAIRAKGARRFFLPQYSPDLNPIAKWTVPEFFYVPTEHAAASQRRVPPG
jgi:hypothetical protein